MNPRSAWMNLRSQWSLDREETANALTHGVGLLLSVVGAIAMVGSVLRDGDAWRVLGCLIYAGSLVAVYAMSTLSHSCCEPQRRRRFRTLDQAFIYVLIAGTYTPFSLAYLRTGPWWLFLTLMWTLAAVGFFSKILLAHRVEAVAIWIYVVLGWLPALAANALVGRLPQIGLWWMLVGGLCYTVGSLFLLFDTRVRHFHALWHVMVMAGSACHFFVIWRFVAGVR